MIIYEAKIHFEKKDLAYKAFSVKNKDKLYKFCRMLINPDSIAEYMIIIGVDSNYVPHSYYVIGGGNEDEVQFTYSTIIRYIIMSGCSKFILVHNHKFNCCFVSKEDSVTFKQLYDITRKLDIEFIDDYIITNSGLISTKNLVLQPTKSKIRHSKKR